MLSSGLPGLLVSVRGSLLLSGDGQVWPLNLPGCLSSLRGGGRPGQHPQPGRESVPGRHDPAQASQEWREGGAGGLDNGAKQGKFLPFLGYLDCRGDKGGERELQLAGWNHLGLRELGRRLLLIINVNTISLLLSGLFVLGEPDRKIPSYKGNHECVFIGKNLDDPGKWWDGVCEWSRWSFDCLCKI